MLSLEEAIGIRVENIRAKRQAEKDRMEAEVQEAQRIIAAVKEIVALAVEKKEGWQVDRRKLRVTKNDDESGYTVAFERGIHSFVMLNTVIRGRGEENGFIMNNIVQWTSPDRNAYSTLLDAIMSTVNTEDL